ncbi:YTH domain-containing protein [Tanacetum coccineum]
MDIRDKIRISKDDPLLKSSSLRVSDQNKHLNKLRGFKDKPQVGRGFPKKSKVIGSDSPRSKWVTRNMIMSTKHGHKTLFLQNSGKVILIYSVNMSGFFQDYAQMMSSVGWRRDNVWSHGHGGGKPWGRRRMEWLKIRVFMVYKMRNMMRDDTGAVRLFIDSFSFAASVDMGIDGSSLVDGWDMYAERGLHANGLTDDDILEMTYEEYLEAYDRGSVILHQPVKESSRKSQDSFVSKEHDDEPYSRSRSKKRSRHHHSHHSHHCSPK